jgi:hypothetical protein
MNNEKISQALAIEIERRFKKCWDILADVNRTVHQQWRAIAGSALDMMLESPGGAESYLRNPYPELRRVALQVLTHHWKAYESIAFPCEQLSLHDDDPEVRIQAICSLGLCYMNTNQARIANILAKLICNDKESDELRTASYLSLLIVVGRTDPHADSCLKAMRLLRFPDDIDQALIGRYA